ncbi:MAG: cytochrome c class I [Candidatus Rokuibacteriota bacterium]|nr:MAG: cytochrome c class I [Candidatus Rokubacteria bacterium]
MNVVTMRRPRGGVMSAFGKSMTAVVAGAALILVAGTLGVLAQGPWVAPPEAKSLKNPVKGVGDAKKLVETNCVTCHGASGHGDGPAAAALPPPKPANWTSDAVQKQSDGEIFWKITNGRGAMPPWKHLPEKERWEIVNYIRTLKGK